MFHCRASMGFVEVPDGYLQCFCSVCHNHLGCSPSLSYILLRCSNCWQQSYMFASLLHRFQNSVDHCNLWNLQCIYWHCMKHALTLKVILPIGLTFQYISQGCSLSIAFLLTSLHLTAIDCFILAIISIIELVECAIGKCSICKQAFCVLPLFPVGQRSLGLSVTRNYCAFGFESKSFLWTIFSHLTMFHSRPNMGSFEVPEYLQCFARVPQSLFWVFSEPLL